MKYLIAALVVLLVMAIPFLLKKRTDGDEDGNHTPIPSNSGSTKPIVDIDDDAEIERPHHPQPEVVDNRPKDELENDTIR